jgi:chromosome segregation ATPase
MPTVVFDVEVDEGQSVKTLGSLRTELEKINEELEQVEVGSKEFTKLSDRARNVSSEIKTLEKTFEGLEPQQKTEAFVKGFEGIAGAVAVTAGSLQLFGVESERIGELEQKVQGAIAIAVGARSVAEGALQARIAARIIAEKAATTATKIATVAQKAFNVVLSANPIGLIVAGVTAAVLIFTKFGDKIKSVIKDNLEPLFNVLEKVGKFLRRVGSAIGLVASEEELAAEKMASAREKRIKAMERELKVQQAAGEETIALERKILDEKLKLYEKDSDEYKDLVNEKAVLEAGYQKKIDDQNAAAAQKRREERQKAREEREAEEQAEREERERKAQEEADRTRKLEEDRLNGIASTLADFRKREEDIEADTELKKIELEQQRALSELDRLNATEEQKQQVREFYARRTQEVITAQEEEGSKERTAIAQREQDAKVAAQVQFAAAVGGIFGELSSLAKEGSAASKAAAIAELAVNTGLGYINALRIAQQSAAATGPGAALAFPIFYATQIASLLGAIGKARSIINTVPGGGGAPTAGRPSTGGGGVGGFGNITPIGQLGEGSVLTPQLGNGNRTPGKVYVLAGDVTSEQEAQAKLNSRRTL